MRIIQPGRYALIPVQGFGDEGAEQSGFVVNIADSNNRFEEDELVLLPASVSVFGTPPAEGIVECPVGPANSLLLSIDLSGGALDPVQLQRYEGPIQTPFGQLTPSDQYVLMPTDSLETNDCPGANYEVNWLTFDFVEPTTIAVADGRILIGDAVLDVVAGPDFNFFLHGLNGEFVDTNEYPLLQWSDFERTDCVIRANTPLHDLVKPMIIGEDDDVMVFLATDQAGIDAIRAIGTNEALLLANHKMEARNDGSFGCILGFSLVGPADTPERKAAYGLNGERWMAAA